MRNTINTSAAKSWLITATGICYSRGGRTILQQIDIDLQRGEIVTLIGPNGAGKSTLVKILLGLCLPDTGRVSRQRKLRTGYVPQTLKVDPGMPITVQRFVALSPHQQNMAVVDALGIAGVTGLAKHSMHHLSGGELRRVLLARALIGNPDLLILDEPAAGVDITGQREIYTMIKEFHQLHQTGVLLVSHDLHLVMAATDRVVCLNQHICCQGSPEVVRDDDAYLALFEAGELAVYTHHHDHQHTIDGRVVHKH